MAHANLALNHPEQGYQVFADASKSLQSNILATLKIWEQRFTTRRQLAKLDSHLFDDIGLDRAAVAAEISKPFWRP